MPLTRFAPARKIVALGHFRNPRLIFVKIRLISFLCAVCCLLGLGAFSGCRNVSDIGNYAFQDGVDYSHLKTYRMVPFPEDVLKTYPTLQAQADTIYKEIDSQMASENFKPAAKDAVADLEMRLNFSQMQPNNPTVKLDEKPDPVGFLMMDIVLNQKVVYRAWSPWGVHMGQFDADSAKMMVQWCLKKFPPPYLKPVTPQVVGLTQQ